MPYLRWCKWIQWNSVSDLYRFYVDFAKKTLTSTERCQHIYSQQFQSTAIFDTISLEITWIAHRVMPFQQRFTLITSYLFTFDWIQFSSFLIEMRWRSTNNLIALQMWIRQILIVDFNEYNILWTWINANLLNDCFVCVCGTQMIPLLSSIIWFKMNGNEYVGLRNREAISFCIASILP